jgi:hypothetical protein
MPFTVHQFFDVIVRYNEAVWPAQWLLVALAVGLITVAFTKQPLAGRIVLGGLALLWLWTGAVYHLAFFSSINPAAKVFGAAFIAQAGLFAWAAARATPLAFQPGWSAAGVTGAVLLAYALVGYPLAGMLGGQSYPAMPTFGLPCPTTIFTLGLLLWARPRASWSLATVPLLWSVLGWTAAFQFGVLEDYGLGIAGLVTFAVLVFRSRPSAVREAARAAQPIGSGQAS